MPQLVFNTDSTASDLVMEKPRPRRYLSQNLRVSHLFEAQLLALTFSIGIQDAIALPFLHCYASMQTGNAMTLSLAAASIVIGGTRLANVGVSLATFTLGTILTGQIANLIGPRRRGYLLVSHFMQTVMVFGAAILLALDHGNISEQRELGTIALLAFSSGAQIASIRPMKVTEITTSMATAAWVDFLIDPVLFARRNIARNRRGLFFVTLYGGCILGGFMVKDVGPSNTILLSAAGKLLVTTTLLFNHGENETQSSSTSDLLEV